MRYSKGIKILGVFILILGILVIYISSLFEKSFEVIELDSPDSNAKCLDGSNYKFLFSKGSGNGTKSFIFFFEPGGFCGDFHSDDDNFDIIPKCINRMSTHLGSNRFNLISKYMISSLSRLMSSKQKYNPDFYNWNKIFVKYCDGTIFHGSLPSPIHTHNKTLYIRGEDNIVEMLNYIDNHFNYSNADNILLTGSSAGAMGVFTWCNYFKRRAAKAALRVIGDSGYFIDSPVPTRKNKNVISGMIKRLVSQLKLPYTKLMSEYCDYKNEMWKCFIPKYNVDKTIRNIPTLVIMSLYDSWVVGKVIGNTCFIGRNVNNGCNEEEIKNFEEHGELILANVKNITTKDTNVTAWLPKGYFHTFIYIYWNWNNNNYAVGNLTLGEVIHKWYHNTLGSKRLFYDVKVNNGIDIFWISKYFAFISKYFER